MLSTLFSVYKKQVFDLARTLIVNHRQAAMIMNVYVAAKGYPVDFTQPSTWKYYLNLAGQYHDVDLDEISLLNKGVSPYILIKTASDHGPVDTPLQRSLFEPPTGDVSLANEYQATDVYFQELVNKYPQYELLIRGIRYPIPLAVSTRALDGEILFCGGYYRTYLAPEGEGFIFTKRAIDGLNDTVLIEPQERQFITQLQDWITAFFVRWYNKDYDQTDDMHFAVLIAMLYAHIPAAILNIRLAAAHTPEAHSYHITAFLEDHGYLGKYVPDLGTREVLWLYRNIRYIYENLGKSETFQLMLDNLVTPSGITLYGYSIRHDLGDQPENFEPNPLMLRETINFQGIGSGRGKLTVRDILDREISLARDNGQFIPQLTNEIEDNIRTSQGNRYPIKYIESVMTDITDRTAYPLSKVLINHWLFCATRGLYGGSIFVTHPVTGDRINLTLLNALILMFYCFNRGYANEDMEYIPTINALFVPRSNVYKPAGFPGIPTNSDIYKKVSSSRVSADTLQTLKGHFTPVYVHSSTDAFFRNCVDIQKEMTRKYFVVAKEEDFRHRGHLAMAMSMHYWLNVPCAMASTPTLYSDWLLENGISTTAMTQRDFADLGIQLLKQGTGVRETQNKKLQRLQTAVMEILKQLTSYSVQYRYSINDNAAITTNTSSLRLSNWRVKGHSKVFIRMPYTGVAKLKAVSLAAPAKLRIPAGVKVYAQAIVLPNYRLHASAPNITEGSQLTITVVTGNVPDGTLVPWTVTGIQLPDLYAGTLTGNFVINDGTASTSFTFAADLVTEGQEVFRLTLDNQSDYIIVPIADSSQGILRLDGSWSLDGSNTLDGVV